MKGYSDSTSRFNERASMSIFFLSQIGFFLEVQPHLSRCTEWCCIVRPRMSRSIMGEC